MKKLLPILILIVGCSKSNNHAVTGPTPNPCNINQALFINKVWINVDTIFASLKFNSNGDYYQMDTTQIGAYGGHWTLTNGCDSVYINRPTTTSFYYRILSLTKDTLHIYSPYFQELTFYHK